MPEYPNRNLQTPAVVPVLCQKTKQTTVLLLTHACLFMQHLLVINTRTGFSLGGVFRKTPPKRACFENVRSRKFKNVGSKSIKKSPPCRSVCVVPCQSLVMIPVAPSGCWNSGLLVILLLV